MIGGCTAGARLTPCATFSGGGSQTVARGVSRAVVAVAIAASIAFGVAAQAPSAANAAEGATAQRFESIRQDRTKLLAFLREMPKGGDLHMHLAGAIYAERYVKWAADSPVCLAVATMTLVVPPCDAGAGRPPAASISEGSPLYDQVIDAWSMRHADPARRGHDHFFATFGRFALATARYGDMLADVTSRAAAEHVSYLEVMLALDAGAAARRGTGAGWNRDLARMRERLLATGFSTMIAEARQRLNVIESRRREILHCDAPAAGAGCGVTVRYIVQVSRVSPRAQVFAQMLAGFELAVADPRVVSLNLLAPEDDRVAVRDFSTHMRMLDYLHSLHPAVPITLHAGELTKDIAPTDALKSHIRDSITRGHASRIGHGVDVMQEQHPMTLLRELAAKRILVEIALSSNDLILGVRGKDHPLRTYLEYGVPVAIATDDEGVSRSSHTQEFLKAVDDHGLDYLTLKAMVRDSLRYSFADPQTRNRLEADLERAFAAFEDRQSSNPEP